MKRISNDIKRLKPKGGGGSIFLQMQSRIAIWQPHIRYAKIKHRG